MQIKQVLGTGSRFRPTSNARNKAMIMEARELVHHIKIFQRDFLALEDSMRGMAFAVESKAPHCTDLKVPPSD